MPEPDLSKLTLDEQLTYWTGVIARNDVRLEADLKFLVRSLTSTPGEPTPEPPREFGRLVKAARALIRDRHLPDDVKTAFRDAIAAANAVHADRIDVVHRVWTPQDDGAIATGFGGDPHREREIESFADIAPKQLLAARRIWGVTNTINSWPGRESPYPGGRVGVQVGLAMARGEFDLDDHDQVVLHDTRLTDAVTELTSTISDSPGA